MTTRYDISCAVKKDECDKLKVSEGLLVVPRYPSLVIIALPLPRETPHRSPLHSAAKEKNTCMLGSLITLYRFMLYADQTLAVELFDSKTRYIFA